MYNNREYWEESNGYRLPRRAGQGAAEGDYGGMSLRYREDWLSTPVGFPTKLPALTLGLSVPVPVTPQQGWPSALHSPAPPSHGSCWAGPSSRATCMRMAEPAILPLLRTCLLPHQHHWQNKAFSSPSLCKYFLQQPLPPAHRMPRPTWLPGDSHACRWQWGPGYHELHPRKLPCFSSSHCCVHERPRDSPDLEEVVAL